MNRYFAVSDVRNLSISKIEDEIKEYEKSTEEFMKIPKDELGISMQMCWN